MTPKPFGQIKNFLKLISQQRLMDPKFKSVIGQKSLRPKPCSIFSSSKMSLLVHRFFIKAFVKETRNNTGNSCSKT
jgi:hypothetical protein